MKAYLQILKMVCTEINYVICEADNQYSMHTPVLNIFDFDIVTSIRVVGLQRRRFVNGMH